MACIPDVALEEKEIERERYACIHIQTFQHRDKLTSNSQNTHKHTHSGSTNLAGYVEADTGLGKTNNRKRTCTVKQQRETNKGKAPLLSIDSSCL